MCQDTGTAIIKGKKGQLVFTGGGDEAALSRGVARTYTETGLRYSQLAPLDMYREKNTNEQPAGADRALRDRRRRLQVPVHGEGRGLGQQELPVPRDQGAAQPREPAAFVEEKMRALGTSACPPYHLALVVGGTSAELTLKTAKLASARYLDTLPTRGGDWGNGFRDLELEQQVLEIARRTGIGAQFGGKYFCHDVRVVRLPRHGASCPVAIAVSCSADRQALGKITKRRRLPRGARADPARFLPEASEGPRRGGRCSSTSRTGP
jgi:fumarate hydratase class I